MYRQRTFQLGINCLATLFIFQAPAQASDEIIVTGTRLNTPLSDTTASVTVITADELQQEGLSFVVDALGRVPGLSVSPNGAFGGLASVRLRGAGTGQTLVLIDGVPVGDSASPNGAFDFGRLNIDSIKSIEILRGAQSVLWGSNAIGGVINIKTKSAADEPVYRLFAELGSFETVRGGLAMNAANTRGDLRISVSGTSADGISKADEADGNRETDPFRSITASVVAGLNLPGNARIEGRLHATDAETEFDGFAPPTFSFGDTAQHTETDEVTATISAKIPVGSRLINEVLIGYTELDRQNFNNGAPGFGSAYGQRTNARYQATIDPADGHRLALGIETEETEVNDDTVFTHSAFALYKSSLSTRITTSVGIRIDDHETFGTETTAQIGGRVAINERVSLRSQWGQGFKAPTLFQLSAAFDARFPANRDLKPEISSGYDLGFEWVTPNGRTDASVTWFDIDIENQINYSTATSNYINIAQVKTQGFEIAANTAANDRLTIAASYTYTDSEAVDLARFIPVAEHSGFLSATYTPTENVTATIATTHIGEKSDFNAGTLDAWTRVDLSGQISLSKSVNAYARVENIFDTDYQQVGGYGTPGVSAYIGIRITPK